MSNVKYQILEFTDGYLSRKPVSRSILYIIFFSGISKILSNLLSTENPLRYHAIDVTKTI